MAEAVFGATQMVGFAFQLFSATIEAYKFCRTAQHIGPEGDFLRARLQIEHYRLERWADRTGLAASRPNPRLNWEAVRDILRLQNTILTSGETLKKRYGLYLPEVGDGGDVGGEGGKKVGGKEGREVGGLERVLRAALHRTSPKHHLALDDPPQAISASNSTFKRLRWAAAGRDKIVKVIDELASLNSELERLLEHAEAQWMRAGLSALLREVVSGSTSLAEVEEAQQLLQADAYADETAIAAAADFKRIRLVAGVDKREDEVRPRDVNVKGTMPALVLLEEKKFSQASPLQSNRRGLHPATYNNRPVLVEWRQAEESKFASLARYMRRLALLLGNADASFSTLHCIGLLAQSKEARFGFVYEAPLPSSKPLEYCSLHDLILSHRKVSLEIRLSIARAMAEAVLQLHTAGWLHKSIRSDNIVFIGEADTDTASLLRTQPYLIGFDYSRPSNATELTEAPLEPLSTDLYRHPDKRCPTPAHYRKHHDLYALGCVLLEIGLWEDVREACSRIDGKNWDFAIRKAEKTNSDLTLPSLLDGIESDILRLDVGHAAGPRYREALELCFAREQSRSLDQLDISLDTQTQIVRILHEIQL